MGPNREKSTAGSSDTLAPEGVRSIVALMVRRRSSSTIRPLRPVPVISESATPISRARRRTAGAA